MRQLVAGRARLAYFCQCTADAVNIADVYRVFQQPLCGEILAKLAECKILPVQFMRPCGVMLERIGIHRLIHPAMCFQVCLTVAFQVEPVQPHTPAHWLFIDARAQRAPTIGDLLRQGDIYRKQFHPSPAISPSSG